MWECILPQRQRRNSSTKCEKEEGREKNLRHSWIPHQSIFFCNYVNEFMFAGSKTVSFLNSKSPRDLQLKYNYMLFVAELYHSKQFHWVMTKYSLEENSTQNGPFNLIQIPCHHALANETALNLKYRMGLKHFFNINLGINIIKKLLFCLYFRHISPCFYSNFDQESLLDA